jgi:hypothetical protein
MVFGSNKSSYKDSVAFFNSLADASTLS